MFRADYPRVAAAHRARADSSATARRCGSPRTRLKGAIATVGAPAGRQAAAELEQIGRAGRLRRGAERRPRPAAP